jgi:hypothetical protein
MEQSPSWESSKSQEEIPRLLWKPKVHYRVHKNPPPVPIMAHKNPIHTLQPYFRKINFNTTLSSTPESPEFIVRRYIVYDITVNK